MSSKQPVEKVREDNTPIIPEHYLSWVLLTAFMTPMDLPTAERCRMGLPTILWGAPGIGKSDIIEAVGRSTELDVHTVYPACLRPDDIGSVIVPDGKGGVQSVLCEPALRAVQHKDEAILFIDEMSGGYAAVQGALMNVILQRRVGDVRLSPNIRILAAANPPESSSGGWELTAPNANRFCHFEWQTPSPSAWAQWLLTRNGVAIPAKPTLDVAEWMGHYDMEARILGQFIKGASSYLHNMPAEGSPQRGRAWPSPRSWVSALHARVTAKTLDAPSDVADLILEGCVGTTATAAYLTYCSKLDLPSPEQVLAGHWKYDPIRSDIAYLALHNTLQYIRAQDTSEVRLACAEALMPTIVTIQRSGQIDIVMPIMTALVDRAIGVRLATARGDTKTALSNFYKALNDMNLSSTEERVLFA